MIMMTHALKAQNTTTKSHKAGKPIQEDSTVLFKIIPAEIPQPILDSLQIRRFQMGDVHTAHRNGTRTMYVIEISHELVREIFWFDPKGHQLRISTKKIN